MSTSPFAITVVEPVTITDAMLTSSNVPETDYAAWNSGTTYALGDRVILTSTHKVYESVQAANLNKNPATEETWWIEVSPTNRWKVFDTANSTQTLNPGGTPPEIAYELTPGQAVNAIGVLNITGGVELVITMTDPVYGLVYTDTVDLSAIPLTPDWWAFFFGQRRAPTQHVATDLPTFPDAVLSVETTGTEELAIGVIMIGQQQRFSLGVRQGARVGIQDYSRKETNDFGDTVLVRRAFAKRANFDMLIAKAEVDPLQKYLSDVRAKACLWIGTEDYESTIVYGFYKNFDILIAYPEHSECSLEIEGLT
jgi:hypothetical protein